jgi:type II secretory pathway component GspD/PulD (secretin)
VSTSDLLKEKNDNLGSTTTGSTTTGSTTTGGDIVASIKEILTTNGKISEDKRTNSLIITDIPSRFPIIEKVLARLDVPQPQIMLEVEMLDVSKNLVDSLGFEFSSNPITLIMPGNFMRRGADFFLGTYTKRGLDITSSTSAGAVILGKTFGQALDFLRTQTDTKYLARPRLLTLNNETAEIKIATQESVGISTTTSETGGTTTNVERVETGVTLRVTPQVNVDTGEITMFLYPKVSEATGGNTITQGSNSYVYRDPEERSTKTMVRIKDGETVIVGGLIRNEFQQVTKKLPILGDLPIIGALFRHKGSTNDKNKERELLVFITPHILKDAYIELAQTKKGMLPEREQDALPAADRGKAINANLNSFEKNR